MPGSVPTGCGGHLWLSNGCVPAENCIAAHLLAAALQTNEFIARLPVHDHVWRFAGAGCVDRLPDIRQKLENGMVLPQLPRQNRTSARHIPAHLFSGKSSSRCASYAVVARKLRWSANTIMGARQIKVAPEAGVQTSLYVVRDTQFLAHP